MPSSQTYICIHNRSKGIFFFSSALHFLFLCLKKVSFLHQNWSGRSFAVYLLFLRRLSSIASVFRKLTLPVVFKSETTMIVTLDRNHVTENTCKSKNCDVFVCLTQPSPRDTGNASVSTTCSFSSFILENALQTIVLVTNLVR